MDELDIDTVELDEKAEEPASEEVPGIEPDSASHEEREPVSPVKEKTNAEAEAEALAGIGLQINAERYATLRALGLTPKEAYLATSVSQAREGGTSHLRSGVPGLAKSPSGGMSGAELEMARGLFSGLSDAEIHKLYKKVTR